MHIANPMYDVVFKYLMEDQASAKIILSTIIGEEIAHVAFLPQESVVTGEWRSWTVYRLDFAARIRHADGSEKQVIIEIQKAKYATDIMRFRRYLGAQYQDKDHTYDATVNGQTVKRALPIVSIYFLGYPLEHTTAPVIKVARAYYDATTGAELRAREEFIESLTHDSYVIQIPYLRAGQQSDLERLLSIFDQHRVVTSDTHVLNFEEADYPEQYRTVLRRLIYAIAEPAVKRSMDLEDDLTEEFESKERELARKDELLAEKTTALEAQNKVVEEQKRLIEALQQRLNHSGA